jgi:adenine-specific DNA methylase
MMEKSLQEAWRVLKPNSPLVMIYAHKTTAGWSTLVEALRKTGFIIQEAWPLTTERQQRITCQWLLLPLHQAYFSVQASEKKERLALMKVMSIHNLKKLLKRE